MVCTAFLAVADTLNRTNYGELKQMETKMQRLYLTMALAWKALESLFICFIPVENNNLYNT
ncbi:hypothetical protein Ahy_A03g013117 [Arachis hypogaea]|uniref:Uncharacterized protein n=1 Tax=Arachis hypogaea TaxID=3818 RepID=A0A445DUT4_ARAHY|nr:hypothetical protein Ahy_A03g013117 [Arachis hypogaea]